MAIPTQNSALAKVSLCMIAKNEERFIAHALRSACDVVDEVILCDTGSNDRTLEIAQEFGAKIFRYEWNDSFADARNFSISKANNPWILVLDSDEMLSDELRAGLAKLATGEPKGVQFRRVHYSEDQALLARLMSGAEISLSPQEMQASLLTVDLRLFPNAPEYRYCGRVHEVVQPSLQSAGCPIVESELVIHHFGGLKSTAEIQNKSEQYLRLGEIKAQELSDKWGPWLELGIEMQCMGRFAEAFSRIERALSLWPENPKAWFHLGLSQLEVGKAEEALLSFQKALSFGAEHSGVWNASGVALLRIGHFEEARRCFRSVLQLEPNNATALCNMGDSYLADGKQQEAKELFEKVLELCPSHSMAASKLQALRLGAVSI